MLLLVCFFDEAVIVSWTQTIAWQRFDLHFFLVQNLRWFSEQADIQCCLPRQCHDWITKKWLPNQPLCNSHVIAGCLERCDIARWVEIWSCLEYSQQVCAVPKRLWMKENRCFLEAIKAGRVLNHEWRWTPLAAYCVFCMFVLGEGA